MRKRNIFLFFFSFVLYFTSNAQKAPVVIELFTSQGCSSCPPADRLIAEIDNTYPDQEVYILSYHVDYWDYIGWKDPFASQANTQKQYEYARRFRSRNVYTPQAVINGREHFTGSNKSQLYSRLQHYQSDEKIIGIELTEVNNKDQAVHVNYALDEGADEITVAVVIKERTTAVKRGENRNRTLKNTNIVVTEQTVKLNGNQGSLSLNIPDWLTSDDDISIIAYATSWQTGVVGVTSSSLNQGS